MKKLIIATLCVLMAGCSHNGLVVIDGKYFGATSSGIHYANGFLLIDESRENSHLRAELSDADSVASGASGNLRGVTAIEKAIGHQATGNLTELAEVAPDAVMGYLQSDPGPAPFSGGNVPEIPVVPASAANSSEKPDSSEKDKANEILHDIKDCLDGSCGPSASSASWTGAGVLQWLGPVQAREIAADGGYVLVMRCASTCSNCAAVCAALDTAEFAEFCVSRNVVLCRMYDDAKYPGGYRLTSDYPDLQKPGFLLCRVLGDPAVCSFAPGAYAEPLAVFPGSLHDTAKKVEDEISKCLN